MDAFFASVEEKLRPPLADHPVAVGGEPTGRHGVVSTANYRARRYGISSGMPLALAIRKCPDLVRLPTDGEKYVHFSLEVLRVLDRYTPLVEPTSVDEAFLDLRGLERHWPDPRDLATSLQEEIRNRVGVTASVGLGPTKMIAKIASGLNKPAGITALSRDGFRRLVGELPVGELWGIGPATTQALRRMGLLRVRDLARADPTGLQHVFGVLGLWLHASARGELDEPVTPYYDAAEAKSFGHEWTLPENISEPEEIRRRLRLLADRVARRLRRKKRSGRTVTLKVRFPDFVTPTRSLTLPVAVDDGREIARAGFFLLERIPFHKRPVRLLGISLSNVEVGSSGAQESFLENRERRRKLLRTVDRIRDRWGERVIAGS
jgi:DNA polymerase-4